MGVRLLRRLESKMLVLSRRKNESIIIGEEEYILTVVEIKGKDVRIGIEAKSDLSINDEKNYGVFMNERLEGLVREGKYIEADKLRDKYRHLFRPSSELSEKISYGMKNSGQYNESGDKLE